MTRVKELDLVNDMFRTRVQQLETTESNLRRELRHRVDEGNRREEALKRKVSELENELIDMKDSVQRKKLRVSDITA